MLSILMVNSIKENHIAYHAKTSQSRVRKVDRNLGKNPKDSRYVPKKKKNHDFSGKSMVEGLWKENQVLRSRLDKLEKTLRKITNMTQGSKGKNIGLGVSKSSNDHRDLGYKSKAKKDKISFHRVPYSYGTNPRSSG